MTVSPGQRFSKARPCPICGGYDSATRGSEKRCHGWQDDRGIPHCSRVESPHSDEGGTWAHLGARSAAPVSREEKPKADLPPPRPYPADRDLPSEVFKTRKFGAPERVDAARDAAGNVLAVQCRYPWPAGEKTYRPWTWRGDAAGWVMNMGGMVTPLVGLDELAARPDAGVLMVEGPKARDAAALRFPGYAVVTPLNGKASVGSHDLTALKGRRVTMWPDADKDGGGEAAFRKGAEAIAEAGAAEVRMVVLPPALAEAKSGWDLADPLPEGVDDEAIASLLRDAPVWSPPAPSSAKAAGAPPRRKRASSRGDDLAVAKFADTDDAELADQVAALELAIAAGPDELAREQLEKDLSAARREQMHRAITRKYGLDLRGTPYLIGDDGVARAVKNPMGDPTVATRPIWPAEVRRDLATGETVVLLRWRNAHGVLVEAWKPYHSLSDAHELTRLDGANVTRGRINRVSDWLGDAVGYLLPEHKAGTVASGIGWLGGGDDRRLVLPGVEGVTFTAEAWETCGTPDGWADGLAAWLALGPAAMSALVVIGLAAAGPLVRFLGNHRNPVVGLVGSSGSGKNSAIEFALAMYAPPDKLLSGMGSTPKGIQDKVWSRALDLVYFLDELHQMLDRDGGPELVSGTIYPLANGIMRDTSSPTRQVVSGPRRWGVNLYASEKAIAEHLARGAGLRVIEIKGGGFPPVKEGDTPAFAPDKPFCQRIKAIATANAGAMASRLSAIATRDQAAIPGHLAALAAEAANRYQSLQGDDHTVIALVTAGLELLAEATGLSIDAPAVGAWLARQAGEARTEAKDPARAALEAVCRAALLGDFRELEYQDIGPPIKMPANFARVGDRFLAWRSGPEFAWLDINPGHPDVIAALRPYQSGRGLPEVWTERGWILQQEKGRYGWKRSGFGRVWRVPGVVLDDFGIRPSDDGRDREIFPLVPYQPGNTGAA